MIHSLPATNPIYLLDSILKSLAHITIHFGAQTWLAADSVCRVKWNVLNPIGGTNGLQIYSEIV